MNTPDRSLPFALVADLDAPVLDADEQHHLERVRRLRAGDRLTVGDGAGRFRVVRFGPSLELDGPVETTARPTPSITIGFALTKGEKPELVVQKLTEVGVDRIVPFRAARSIVRWDDDKARRNVARWRLVARAAAAQAHQPWLPEIAEVTELAAMTGRAGTSFADPEGDPPSLDHPTVLVGPEGGWSADELAAAEHRTRLGGTILRAETAAVIAGALLVALRGDGNAPLVRNVAL